MCAQVNSNRSYRASVTEVARRALQEWPAEITDVCG